MDGFLAQVILKTFNSTMTYRCIDCCHSKLRSRQNVRSQLAKLTRSMIPITCFWGRIVSRILNNEQLYQEWLADLKTMVDQFTPCANNFMTCCKLRLGKLGTRHYAIGMFSYTGLSTKQSWWCGKSFTFIWLTAESIAVAWIVEILPILPSLWIGCS